MSHNRQRMREEATERRARRRKEDSDRRGKYIVTAAIAAVILVAGIAIFYSLNSHPPTAYEPAQEVGGSAGSTVTTVPVSSVDSTARFYTYNSGGTQVRFFLARGTDGQAHLAADACDVCYGSHKGYRQTNDVMACNNCGKTFAINNLGVKNTSGGCWPSYIPMKLEGGNVVIQNTDLDAKAYMFR